MWLNWQLANLIYLPVIFPINLKAPLAAEKLGGLRDAFKNVYLLVRHVPFIAKSAGFLLPCTKCSRQASLVKRCLSLNFVQTRWHNKESWFDKKGGFRYIIFNASGGPSSNLAEDESWIKQQSKYVCNKNSCFLMFTNVPGMP